MEKEKENVLKRAVLKEELVALTQNPIKGLILNQLLYWQERTKDTDKYIKEEKIRSKCIGKEVDIPLLNGWIYKSAEELSEELMYIQAPRTISKLLKDLVSDGYLEVRQNPYNNWDKKHQYRVNLIKVKIELQKLGYALEGYSLASKIEIDPISTTDQSICATYKSTGFSGETIGTSCQAISDINIYTNNPENLSVSQYNGIDERIQERINFEKIKINCRLDQVDQVFGSDTENVVSNALVRMYYSDVLKIGNANIPQDMVRSRMLLLDCQIINYSLNKLMSETHKNNAKRIKNSTYYLISTIYNAITEYHTDPALNFSHIQKEEYDG